MKKMFLANLCFVLGSALCFFAVLSPLAGQVPTANAAASADDHLGKCSIYRHGWSDDGKLVFGVKIHGGKSGTNLGEIQGEGSEESLAAFSMGTSSLVDVHSGTTLKPLDSLPTKPFFGTMTGIIRLNPGDAVVFGVAFPRPPDPPKGKDGKTMDYKLKLLVPGLKPLDFQIPYRPPQGSAAG